MSSVALREARERPAPYDAPVSNHQGRPHGFVLDEPGGNVLLDMFVLDQRLAALLKTSLLVEGVSPAHYAVYAQVGRGVETPGELAERLSLSPGTLTGYLDVLERRGHLLRAKSPDDGRFVTLSLTAEGEAKRLACQHVVSRLVRRLDRALGGTAARNELRHALGALSAGLNVVEAASPESTTPAPGRSARLS